MRRRLSLLLLAAALLAAGCGESRPAAPAAPETPAPRTAWDQISERIGPDGSIDRDTALTAFSTYIAPLPGVAPIAGPRPPLASASGVLRWAIGHLAEMTPEQRTAVKRSVTADLLAQPNVVLSSFVLSDASTVQAAYQKKVDSWNAVIAGRLGVAPLSGITATIGGKNDAAGDLAEALARDGAGDYVGPYATCAITFFPSLVKMKNVAADRETVPHEVFHCYEARGFPSLNAFYNSIPAAPWLIEGAAEWAGDSLAGTATLGAGFWAGYLRAPRKPLFQRSYDALGFYSHLAEAGVDPWGRFTAMFTAGPSGNMAAYDAAVKGAEDSVLATWPSGFSRRRPLGSPWDTTGPGITSSKAKALPAGVVANASAAQGSVDTLANGLYEVNLTADVVLMQTGPHSRLHALAGAFESTDGSAVFCTRASCACPGDTSPPLPHLQAGKHLLAVSAGRSTFTWKIAGQSTETSCQPVDPCMVGRWKVTTPLDIPRINASGGGGEIVTFTAAGLETVEFDPQVVGRGSVQGLDVSVKARGTGQARVRATRGRIAIRDVNLSGVSVAYTLNGSPLGEQPLAGYTFFADGTYTCSKGVSLTLTSAAGRTIAAVPA
ncbi:MAG: hypothetical protein NVSMB29_16480 [Candidatus Dormibacteria bacterium]